MKYNSCLILPLLNPINSLMYCVLFKRLFVNFHWDVILFITLLYFVRPAVLGGTKAVRFHTNASPRLGVCARV